MPTVGIFLSFVRSLGFLLFITNKLTSAAFRIVANRFFNKHISVYDYDLRSFGSGTSKDSGFPVAEFESLPSWSSLYSRLSIETVIHSGDCEDYDVNSVQYRKARYWRELSTPEIEEEIRKVRKILSKIELYRKTKNPALNPGSLRNTKRTLAQLLFIRHERHLRSLREKAVEGGA
ncbi:putative ribosomal protein L29 [Babesia bovis T2Bo]|uniref:Ribosomal protein L29, putative n=1 Tax=Babesia bovis TaxID=5865 RepID=A7AR19_BABBO|nr:putative ribosomal protein L29 [Babesia bovis T2Bo]EDO06988.1 putative ribosomal protein L29 [Babesia bovis T2Bo]|eukprot:XP_001610556.1 ribosomal protein L29 [Babesia bovis T2Bo]